jgi:hypothetical protein
MAVTGVSIAPGRQNSTDYIVQVSTARESRPCTGDTGGGVYVPYAVRKLANAVQSTSVPVRIGIQRARASRTPSSFTGFAT